MLFNVLCNVFLDNENVLQPDLLFISKERAGVIGRRNIQGAPDLAVETLSESTAYNDLMKKKRLYAKFGVREYWIVDTDVKTVEIHSLKNGAFVLDNTFSESDQRVSPLFFCLRIKLSTVFAFL